jgi:hypothetical protein
VTKLCIKFEEVLSRAYGNSEEKNEVLEPSVIIINFCIIVIINAYYNLFVFGATAPPHLGARASSFTRYLDHTQRRITVGRTALD